VKAAASGGFEILELDAISEVLGMLLKAPAPDAPRLAFLALGEGGLKNCKRLALGKTQRIEVTKKVVDSACRAFFAFICIDGFLDAKVRKATRP
jgi:hypothetical protein